MMVFGLSELVTAVTRLLDGTNKVAIVTDGSRNTEIKVVKA